MITNGQNGRPASTLKASSFAAQRPTLFVIILFFLLFSGPPSFRLRDPFDSIEGVIDPTVIFQSVVWVLAGIWCLLQLRKDLRPPSSMKLGLPQKLGLVMILFLALSIFESEAPLLTAFKVGQLLVSLLFSWIFVQRYGIARVIDYVFLGSVALCTAIGICAFAAPDMVFFMDEGVMRLRGDPIAVMGTVGTFSTILLFVKRRQIPNVIFWPLLAMLCTLLAFSLTRHAWFLVSAFLLLYFARQSKRPIIRTLGFVFLAVFPIVFFVFILPALQDYRATDSVGTLTGRTDLWMYLVDVALTKAAWTGLGYYSASRVLGIDFNPGMGTAHSIFVEVLLGGGLLSLIPCMALCFSLTRMALQFLSKKRTNLQFVCGALFLVTMIIGLLGGDFASGEIGIIFWSLAAAIPAMHRQPFLAPQNLNLPSFTKLARATGTDIILDDSRRAET